MIYLADMSRLAAILLGLIVSACSSTAGPVAAQDAPREPLRTLSVSANATVVRSPDRAVLGLAVETVAQTAREAMRQNAEAMTAVIAALEELGIERSAIQTRSIGLDPRYRRGPDVEEPTIVAYRASNQLSVRVDDVDGLGRVVDAGIEAGANRVTGIQFEIADPEAAYHEALEKAVAQARREAEVTAAAMGETLGPAFQVSTGDVQGPTPGPMMAAMRMESASTPVEPGELEVRASVQITFRLGS